MQSAVTTTEINKLDKILFVKGHGTVPNISFPFSSWQQLCREQRRSCHRSSLKTQCLRRSCNFAQKLTWALCQVPFAPCTEMRAAVVLKGVMKLHLLKNTALPEISSLTSVRLGEVGRGAWEPQEQHKRQDTDAVTTKARVTAACRRGSSMNDASVWQRNGHKSWSSFFFF